MKIFLLATLFSTSTLFVFSQIPSGYYDGTDGLSGEDLKSNLHTIIKTGHTKIPYTSSSTDVWDVLKETDRDPDNALNVILIYKGISIDAAQEYNDGNGWTREHIWAKSHGFPDEGDYGYTDVHHLRPCDNSVNMDRGTKDFDNGGTQHDEATECFTDSDSWEPRDAVKGDVARMMFYMAVRYEGDGGTDDDYDLELVDYTGTTVGSTLFGKLSTLLLWHEQDPVDDFERNRNDIIYYDYQHNRNPFIDYPEFVDYIWGGETPNTPSIKNIEIVPEKPEPDQEISVSAKVTDDQTVVSVTLLWCTDGVSFNNSVSMLDADLDDIYETDPPIPGQENNTTLTFKIIAEDNDENSTTSEIIEIEINDDITVISEDFSDCPPTNWTIFSISGNEDWACETGIMGINAYNADVASDDWLISPAIDLNTYSGEKLTFESWTQYTDINFPQLRLKYSTNYSGTGSPELADWTVLSFIAPTENSTIWTGSGEIDVSSIYSEQVYFAFQYISSGTGASTSSSWKVDDFLIIGKEQGDISPPVFTENYPSVGNVGGTSLDLIVSLNEPGKTYFLVIADNATEPTISEIKQGSSIDVLLEDTEYFISVTNLIPETAYDIYVVAEDDEDSPNLQSSSTKIDVITNQEDLLAPEFISGYPSIENIQAFSCDLKIELNENGKVFYKVLLNDQPVPTINELLESSELLINNELVVYTFNIEDLISESQYSIYCIAQDDETTPNVQSEITTLNFSTLGIAPVITLQPIEDEICEATSFSLNVEATSLSDILYQWYKNQVIVEGANSSILDFNSISISDIGNYYCLLENSIGITSTDTVDVEVGALPFAGNDTSFIVCSNLNSISLLDYLPGADTTGVFFDNSQSGALSGIIFNVDQVSVGSYNFTYFVEGGPCTDDYSVINVTVDNCNSIIENSGLELNMFFNANDELNITSSEPIQNITIYNFYGQIIDAFTVEDTYFYMSESSLKNGIYVIRIQTPSGQYSSKIHK